MREKNKKRERERGRERRENVSSFYYLILSSFSFLFRNMKNAAR